MSDREKLIELLCFGTQITEICDTDTFQDCKTCRGDCGYCTILADHLISNGVTVQKWIPVSEPPKERGTYQVYIHDKEWERMRVWYGCFQQPCHWSVYDIYGNGVPCEVFFWMPLPEPPKE